MPHRQIAFGSKLNLWFVAALVVLACTSVEPTVVDTSVAQAVRAPSLSTLRGQFEGFRHVVVDGTHVKSGQPSPNKAHDWVHGTIVYVPGDYSPKYPEVRSWSVDVDILTFHSAPDAVAYQEHACGALAMLLQRERGIVLSRTDRGGVHECSTPQVQLRSDAGGLYLPMDSFVAGIVVRNDTTVIKLQERRAGHASGTALQGALEDVVRRLRSPIP
jgi:hypothetical protein